MEEVASPVGDAPLPVPVGAPAKLPDIADNVLFDAFVQDDGFQRSLGLGLTELAPVIRRAVAGEGQRLALVLLQGFGSRLLQDVDEQLSLFPCEKNVKIYSEEVIFRFEPGLASPKSRRQNLPKKTARDFRDQRSSGGILPNLLNRIAISNVSGKICPKKRIFLD